jgi:hypothetical protein
MAETIRLVASEGAMRAARRFGMPALAIMPLVPLNYNSNSKVHYRSRAVQGGRDLDRIYGLLRPPSNRQTL